MPKVDVSKKENFRPHALRYLRERKACLSVAELASKMRVAQNQVYRWENPKTEHVPSFKNIKKLCRILGCKQADLYSDFKPEMLSEVLDDMLELIIADFYENIKSDKTGLKNIAVKEYELLKNIQHEQELRTAQTGQSAESANIDIQIHQMQYPSNENPDEDKIDDETQN